MTTTAGRVGKTSLSSSWINGNFNEGQQPTQTAAFAAKKVSIDGMVVEVAVWDTAGQERFHALGEAHQQVSYAQASHALYHMHQMCVTLAWAVHEHFLPQKRSLTVPCAVIFLRRPYLLPECRCRAAGV